MGYLWMLPSVAVSLFWGASTGNWQYPLMSISSIAISLLAQRSRQQSGKHSDDVMAQYATTWNGKRWSIGARVLPRSWLFWRRHERSRVAAELRAIAASNASRNAFAARRAMGFSVIGLPSPAVWLGRSGNADLELSLARDGPHVFVVGPTGSGKSRLLALFAASVVVSASSGVGFRLFDSKGGATLGDLAVRFGLPIATDLDLDLAEAACGELVALLDKRERLLAASAVDHFERFNGLRLQRRRLEPVLVLIDELGSLLRLVPSALAALEAIASRGRSLGVFLVAANQTTSGISRGLLANFRQRIALTGTDPVDAVQLGFGSAPNFGFSDHGWASAVLYDSAERTVRPLSFPLSLD